MSNNPIFLKIFHSDEFFWFFPYKIIFYLLGGDGEDAREASCGVDPETLSQPFIFLGEVDIFLRFCF